MKGFLTDYWDAVVTVIVVIALMLLFALVQGCSVVSVQVATDGSNVKKAVDAALDRE